MFADFNLIIYCKLFGRYVGYLRLLFMAYLICRATLLEINLRRIYHVLLRLVSWMKLSLNQPCLYDDAKFVSLMVRTSNLRY